MVEENDDDEDEEEVDDDVDIDGDDYVKLLAWSSKPNLLDAAGNHIIEEDKDDENYWGWHVWQLMVESKGKEKGGG